MADDNSDNTGNKENSSNETANQNLSRAERKKLRKQEFKGQKKAEQDEKKKKSNVKNIIIIGVALVILAVVVIAFVNLTAFKMPVKNPSDPFFGSTDSKVVVIEFGDLQCSYTRAFHNGAFKELRAKYGDKVQWVSKEMVTGKYPNSAFASNAALCAGEQGKYFQYQEIVFDRSAADSASLRSYAKILELDVGKFDKCMQENKFKDKINNDYRDGKNAKVAITPTFFVNGIKLEGDIPLQYFQQVIEGELNR